MSAPIDARSLHPFPGWVSGLLVLATFGMLTWLETRRPLRSSRQKKLARNARNLAIAGLSAAAIRAAELPVVLSLSGWVEQRRWGLLKLVDVPLWLELAAAVVLLDYTLFVWHVLTHKVPLLWRFHQAHHVDLDMDASTALRFHFGEMLLSVPWRAGQVLLIGASPLALSLWQTATVLEILFHHSNVEIPWTVERRLCWFLVTPRMHGIHHSIIHDETDSNWSTIFSFPDFLHGTVRLNVPHDAITIGIPAYQDAAELTLPKVLALPLRKQRPSWKLLSDQEPRRSTPALPRTRLAG